MNTDIHSKSPTNQLQETAWEISRSSAEVAKKVKEQIKEYAQQAVDATKDAAHRASVAAKDMYQSASARAEDALVGSKEYAQQHPLPVALGSLIVGLTIGYLIGVVQREEPSFRQRFFR
jgi:ElaB/YqjD/DUF883 family membrane-anchored ribosome-binding protein